MPKDAKKNVDRYKVAGGHLNEFEFHQNQGQMRESASTPKATARKSASPSNRATASKTASSKTASSKTAAGKRSAKPVASKKSANPAASKKSANPVRGATAKKLAARKAARTRLASYNAEASAKK